MNLFLIGYRGSGKTTVARIVAEKLGWDWKDADIELETQAGRTIQDIFATSGESAFRDLEEKTLQDLAAGNQQVLALGGGVILRENNRAILARRGKTVWLQAPADILFERISSDPTTGQRRPDLTPQGGLAEVEQLLALRNPLYEQAADLIIETQNQSPSQIADRIVHWWEETQGPSSS